MLEVLILYVLNKNDNTLYGLKKEIATHYGEVSIPSHGALFPAIKRLQNKGLVSVRKKLSDGGKRYTYYSINSASEYFNKRFMEFNNSKSETFDSYIIWLKSRLITIDFLDKDLVSEFREKCLLKLNFFKEKIIEKQNNKYLNLTDLQNKLLQISLNQIEEYNKIIDKI